MKFRKKPVEVEAWQYDGRWDLEAAPEWLRAYRFNGKRVGPKR